MVCGLPSPVLPAVHHRKLRSQGGKDTPANLLALHHSCHNLGTHSVHLNPSLAYERGWLVPMGYEPEEYPVTLPDGRRVLLTAEEEYEYLEGEHHGW